MDDLYFLTVGYFLFEIQKILKKIGNITLSWETNNAIIYDISKTKIILFSKIKNQKLIK